MATTRKVKPLHELLLEQGVLTAEQLQNAKAQAAKIGQPLKRVIVQQGIIAEADLASLVATQLGLTHIDLSNYVIKPEVVQLVPEAMARKHTLVPVFKIGQNLTVAMDDPLNFFAVDELRLRTKCQIKTVVASESSIRQAIDQYYGATGTMAEVAQAIEEAGAPKPGGAFAIPEGAVPKEDTAAAEEAPVIRLVNLLIMQAVKERASDIHIEPGDKKLRTRFRVDGVLQEINGPPAYLHSAVVSRIKVLTQLDIAEKRKPQDGRFRLKMEGKDIDLRVSTIPTQFGEKVVMRLLESASAYLTLEELGLEASLRAEVERLIRLPHGILLVTGPTGSGKTTTLYAALALINDVSQNIVTIEDPVEYQLAGVNQVQVNTKAEVTFASALRSFLRQDPDVIMVGEIRDRETAEIGIQAALTGHLVFSTLHTNDAASSLTRLLDMGVEPFLISSSIVGVLAQRLVRVICPKCKQSYRPSEELISDLQMKVNGQFLRGKGCNSCKKAGYKGRVGIFELLTVTDEVRELITARASAHVIREATRKRGMRFLRDDGLGKAQEGVTTLEEVLRVSQLE